VAHLSGEAARVAIVAGWIADAWGGSEELWSRSALHLGNRRVTVAASIERRTPPHDRVRDLRASGITLSERDTHVPLSRRVWRRIVAETRNEELVQIERFLHSFRPALAVLQSGVALPPIDVVELCVRTGVPFVTIGHANSESWWLVDEVAKRYRDVLCNAIRCYFVSRANLQLTEKQIGSALPNAEIIQNPFNVMYDVDLPWPEVENEEVRFACVGRLDVRAKGQDILLEALAGPVWADRNWRLRIYGDGPMREGIENLIKRFSLTKRVSVEGYVAKTERIWRENHALVMASRVEGLPLTIVEAMLCRRPVIATDVAGNAEIIKEGTTGFIADAPTASSVALALERFWCRRHEMEEMGLAAGTSIRGWVVEDPAKAFAEKIEALLSTIAKSAARPLINFL
jgi:glycosyltransferase involved in cell wall biosynthesis